MSISWFVIDADIALMGEMIMKDRSRGNITLTLCIIVGLFLFASGIFALFIQSAADVVFDLHGDNSISGNTLAGAFGIRQLAIGSMIIVFALLRQFKGLGIVMLVGAIVPLADFLLFSAQIGVVSALRHGMMVPAILGIGVYLLVSKKLH